MNFLKNFFSFMNFHLFWLCKLFFDQIATKNVFFLHFFSKFSAMWLCKLFLQYKKAFLLLFVFIKIASILIGQTFFLQPTPNIIYLGWILTWILSNYLKNYSSLPWIVSWFHTDCDCAIFLSQWPQGIIFSCIMSFMNLE